MKILLSEEQYGRLVNEVQFKFDPDEARKIIKGYKSVPDFAHDHPSMFRAITDRIAQKEYLGHLYKDVSYKTGEAVKVPGFRNFDFDTKPKSEKELRIREFINIPFNPFNKEIGTQIRQFLVHKPFYLVKEMKEKYPNEDIEGPFLEKLKNIILDVASKYTYKTQFTRNESKIEHLIKTHDQIYSDDEPWMPLINKIMVPVGNLFKRMNYVFEFPVWKGETDLELKGKPTAYVGLTADEVKRKSAHRNSDSSQVYKYMRKTGLEPNFYRLVKNKNGKIVKTTDLNYVSAFDAQELEKESLKMYKRLGFNTINIKEAGGLGGKGGGGLIANNILDFKKFAVSTGTELRLLKLIPETRKDEGETKTRIFVYAEQNDLVTKVINRIQEILHANQNVTYLYSKLGNLNSVDSYSKGAVQFILEYEKDYNNQDKKTFRSNLFGQEIMKSEQRETLDKLNKFLEIPNNFNMDQLSFLSHGTWDQLKKTPEKIDIVFDKLKSILEKNNIKVLGNFNDKKEGSLIYYSSPTYGFIARHDKDNPNDKWRDKLFGTIEEYRKMGDLNKNMPRIYNFINGDNSTETLKNITKDGYSYLKLFNELHPEKNIMTLFFNKLKEIITTNNITRYNPSTSVTKSNPNYTKSLGDYWSSIAVVVLRHDNDNPNDKWKNKLFPNLNESKLSFENVLTEKLRDMIPSPIYHHTTEERALSIMNSDMLIGTKPFQALIDIDPSLKHSKHKMMVSFTRDKNFIPDASIGNSGDGPRVKFGSMKVIFVADRNRLKTRYRVVPFDYSTLADRAWEEPIPRTHKNPEVEERVLTNRIYPLRQYITNIIYTGQDPEIQKKIDEYLSGIK